MVTSHLFLLVFVINILKITIISELYVFSFSIFLFEGYYFIFYEEDNDYFVSLTTCQFLIYLVNSYPLIAICTNKYKNYEIMIIWTYKIKYNITIEYILLMAYYSSIIKELDASRKLGSELALEKHQQDI